MSRLQKILTILSFVIFVFIVGFFIYSLFFRSIIEPDDQGIIADQTPGGLPLAGTNLNVRTLTNQGGTLPSQLSGNVNVSPTPTPSPQDQTSNIANGGKTRVTALTDFAVSSPRLGANGKDIKYYDRNQGLFYEITDDGRTRVLSEKRFHQVQNVVWSPNNSSAILEYPDGANIFYDFQKDKQVTLPKHWESFNFSPTGSEIIAKSIGNSLESKYLITANPEGSNMKTLGQLPSDPSTIVADWSPNNVMVAMRKGDIDFDTKEIFFIGKNEENFQSMTVEGWGFESSWAPNGNKLLYSVHSDRTDSKPELWIADATPGNVGRNRKNLKLETWSHKCAFQDGQNAYCAVPSALPTGAGFFPAQTDNAPDILYRVDINTGSKTLVALPDRNVNMQNLVVSSDGRYLFFVNSFDGTLNRIALR